jgi:hypothetical protein
MMPPHDALQARSINGCPLCSNETTNVLQSVRPHWKVDLAIDVSIDIDQTLENAFGVSIVSFRELRYCSWLVATVMIDWCLRVLLDLVDELLPHVTFVLVRIRPECMVLRGISLTH